MTILELKKASANLSDEMPAYVCAYPANLFEAICLDVEG